MLYPTVEILLTEVGSKKIKQGVDDGSLDIGLICNTPLKNSSFEAVQVIKDPLMLIVHHEHPLSVLLGSRSMLILNVSHLFYIETILPCMIAFSKNVRRKGFIRTLCARVLKRIL